MNNNEQMPSGFPSHLEDSNNKGKAWISQYIKAAWNDFTKYYPNQLYNGRESYHETKMYMLGKQSTNKYRKLLSPRDAANGDSSWININWDILPIIPKFRRIAIATLSKADFSINIDAIDPIAQDDKVNFYSQNAARITLRQEFEKQGLDKDMIPPPDVDVESIKELDMYMEYSYKHRMATEMEQALEVVNTQNNFDQIVDRLIEDTHDYGICCTKDFFDAAGTIRTRRVNPSNMIMSYSTSPTFEDVQYIGEVIEMTIADLKDIAGSQISEMDYEKIANKYVGKIGNPAVLKDVNNDYERNYDGFRVKVLDLEFFSTNSMILEERLNSKGNTVVGRASKVKKNRTDKKYSKTDYKVVYQGKWVVDTDIFFDCELQTNMKRAKNSMTDAVLSYHVAAPDIYQMSTYSIGQQMKPIADQIQIAWYKLQNVILRARPRGIMIELGALENVPLGRGGQALKPMEIIDLYNQTGNLVYRRLDDQGQASNYKPIEELDNGIGNEATQYFNIINQNIQLLREIIGFNEITDGSTPDPRTLNGVAKYAAESTNNSLDFIKRAVRGLIERLSYSLMIRVQDSAQYGNIKGYVRSIGGSSVEFFKLDPNVSAYELGLTVTSKPTEFEKEKLARRVEQAIQSNQITLADAMMIERLDNMKYAELMLAYRIKKNQEDVQKRSLEAQEMNAKVQQESALVAEQAKQQTIQVETQAKLMVLQKEKELDMQIMLAKLNQEAQIQQMIAEKKVDAARIEASSREYIAEMKKSMADLGKSKK
jgi:hypothetical protein